MKNMWNAKPHSAVNCMSQSEHSSKALLTTPPSSLIQLERPKKAQASIPAWTTTSTAIEFARNLYVFIVMLRFSADSGPQAEVMSRIIVTRSADRNGSI